MRRTLQLLCAVGVAAVFCSSPALFAGAVTSKEELKISTTGGGIKIKSNNGNSFAIGGRILYDYDSYDGLWSEVNHDQDDSASESEFRRTRVTLKGTSGKNWGYKFAVDIDEGEAEMDTAVISYKGMGFGTAKVGRFKAPFGLEELTSSKWVSTIERSPTPELGFLADKPSFQFALHGHSKPMFWQAALIDEDNEDDDGSDAYSIAGRVGGYFSMGEDSFMHLAGSLASRDFGNDGQKRFRTRLGIHSIGSMPIDHKIAVDDADQYGLEAAAVLGPFSLQAEYRNVDFDGRETAEDAEYQGKGDVEAEGYYVQASYIVTGETRGYKGSSGKFDKLKPKGPNGAVELVAKYEDGELDIDDVAEKNEFELFTLGVNWYATQNVKLMLNYLDVDTDHANQVDPGQDEDGQAVSFRAQYAF
ncbi:MAG: porin [Gammaproteobacteria bacterium]|nr:porin [Gammaproteobacteria bacterium]